MPAAGEIHRLKKRRLPAGFLAGDESVKLNGQFNFSLSRLNLIFSRQPNFLVTTLIITYHFFNYFLQENSDPVKNSAVTRSVVD